MKKESGSPGWILWSGPPTTMGCPRTCCWAISPAPRSPGAPCPRDPEAVLPSQYAREAEQTIRDSLDALLDLLARSYDPGVFCYASIYLGEVLYELLRHFFRLSPDYDPALFSMSDESFDSGAVVSDITWVRAQYILSIRQFQDISPLLPTLTQRQFSQRYGQEVCDSIQRLFSMVSRRVTQQGLTESLMTIERFEPHAKPGNLKIVSPQEVSL